MTIRNLIPFGKKGVPVKREDDNPFSLLRREMDSLFENFSNGFAPGSFEGRFGAFSPKVDVTESDKEIKVSAELPGMDEKDIDISLHNNMLSIRGEKKEEKEDKGKDYYRMERSYGSFSRTIQVPAEVEADKVEATFKKGVLSISLPKTARAVEETKKIAVKVE